ncbi:hypothetical protein ACN4EE_20260 [Geminocystis sp. CENA526]|uniref:hypothetical protein n=1 Tax=Geminocystis sp. CENA526 TaxID=1355871 RepID=UPI003D6DBAF6
MELIICLVLAVSAFVAAITCIVGLVSAPTPILLAILATGMLLTQKSITKFTEPSVNLDDRDKNRIEKVEIASNSIIPEDQNSQQKKSSMTYRGFHYNRLKYNRLKNFDSAPQSKQSTVTYRGAKINKKEIV